MVLKSLLKNYWLTIHKLIYNRILNNAITKPKQIPFKVIKTGQDSDILISSINEYIKNIDLRNVIKSRINQLLNKLRYRVDLYDLLDIDIKTKIIEFALFQKKIRLFNLNYFGFNPRIHKIELLYNMPNNKLSEEGSKLWHRDLDCDYKNIKLFLPLNKITKENVPFFYLKDKRLKSRFDTLKTNNTSLDLWKRGRVDNETIEANSKNIDSFLSLKKGDSLLIDTVNIYHKGGYCKSKPRLLLHISYQGNGWTSDKPQNFSKEIKKIFKKESNKRKLKILNDELNNYKIFTKSTKKLKITRKLIYKLSNFFISEKRFT